MFSVEFDRHHILGGPLPSKDRITAVIFKTYCLFNPTFFKSSNVIFKISFIIQHIHVNVAGGMMASDSSM